LIDETHSHDCNVTSSCLTTKYPDSYVFLCCGKVNHVWHQSFLFCNDMAVSILLDVSESHCLSVVTGFTFNNGLLQIIQGLFYVCMLCSFFFCSFIITKFLGLVMSSNTIDLESYGYHTLEGNFVIFWSSNNLYQSVYWLCKITFSFYATLLI